MRISIVVKDKKVAEFASIHSDAYYYTSPFLLQRIVLRMPALRGGKLNKKKQIQIFKNKEVEELDLTKDFLTQVFYLN